MEQNTIECEIVAMGLLTPDHDGIGTAFSPFTDCVQGIGNTQAEAMDDALEMAAQITDLSRFDLKEIEKEINRVDEEAWEYGDPPAIDFGEDFYYYAAFRWKED
jgi:hypothetical protein